MKYNLVATAWIKNEQNYLPQWIEFHLLQGFDKFIFYDNNSTDKTEEILSSYISDGVVELRKYPQFVLERKNFWVIKNTILEFSGVSNWLYHHSVDEYMYCRNGTTVSEFLNNYIGFAGVAIPWKLFNANGHNEKIKGLVIERFTEYINDPNYHIKTIICPEKTIDCVGNPHAFTHSQSDTVYSNNISIHRNSHAGAMCHNNFYDLESICMNHYDCMSLEEFNNKMNKGLLDNSTENVRRQGSDEKWDFLNNPYVEKNFDPYIKDKYSDIIKNKLSDRNLMWTIE